MSQTSDEINIKLEDGFSESKNTLGCPSDDVWSFNSSGGAVDPDSLLF